MEVSHHFGKDFGPLGTSFIKSGTSFTNFDIFSKKKLVYQIPKLLGPLSYYPRSVYSFRDLWEVLRCHSLLRNGLWNPRYIIEKI